MTDIIFYEKPGCLGNRQQQAMLRRHGHRLVIRDLLSEPWTADRLLPFLAGRVVPDWFNTSAPKVRDGEIDIHELDGDAALGLLLEEPLLIRRPLLQYGEARQSGFSPGPVLDALNMVLDSENDCQPCPVETENASVCRETT